MRKLLCASTASLRIGSSSAARRPIAADLSVAPIYKAPPTPLANWTGSYVGISGGGVWGNAVVLQRA